MHHPKQPVRRQAIQEYTYHVKLSIRKEICKYDFQFVHHGELKFGKEAQCPRTDLTFLLRTKTITS